MDDLEKTWKEINTDIDLYKFYMDLLIKSATFLYAITGAVTIYFISNNAKPLMRYSLLLPLIMNLGFVIICFLAIVPVREMINDFNGSCRDAGFPRPYKMSPLLILLWLFSISYCLIIVALTLLFLNKLN